MTSIRWKFVSGVLLGLLALWSVPVKSGGTLDELNIIAAMVAPQSEVAMAYNSVRDEFLVVWVANVDGVDQLYGRIVEDPSVSATSPIFQITGFSRDSYAPDLVFNPSTNQYLVVWTYDFSGDGVDTDVWGQILTASGPDPAFLPFAIANRSEREAQPAVGLRPSASAVTGFAYIVAWQYQAPQTFARMEMQLLDQAGLAVGGVVGTPVIAADVSEPEFPDEPLSNRQQLVFSTARNAGDIEAAVFSIVNDTISNVQLQAVSGFPGAEGQPDIALCNGVWHYNWVGDGEIYTRSMNANLELSPIKRLSPIAASMQHRDPAIACRSNEVRVSHAWAATRQIGGDQLHELWNLDTLDSSMTVARTYLQSEPIHQPALVASATGLVLVAATLEGFFLGQNQIHGFGYRSRIRQSERDALVDFYWNAGGPGWSRNDHWLSPPGSECRWIGVACGGDLLDVYVGELNLESNGLIGSISPRLAELPGLEYLRLSQNGLSGPIPADLTRLDQLRLLELWDNQLSGPIPRPQTNQWLNLITLDLSFNQLSGTLPPELFQRDQLLFLTLSVNRLAGTLPAIQQGQSPNLRTIHLGGNSLTGSIPVSWLNLDSLASLWLTGNLLSGSVPSPGPGQWSNLRELFLDSNRLSGPIPHGLGQLDQLILLRLDSNQLSGDLPETLLELDRIEEMNLADNAFTGPMLNPQPGDWQNLKVFLVSGNQLTGGIPAAWGQLPNLDSWFIASNALAGPLPDSLLGSSLSTVDLRWNALYTQNDALAQYLNARQITTFDWRISQTVSPATLSTQMGGRSALLEWPSAATPLLTLPGKYRLWFRFIGNPWICGGQTADKNTLQLPIIDLVPDSVYEFSVTTVTEPHSQNQNRVESALEPMWMTSTGPDCPPLPEIQPTWGFPDTLLESNLVFADYLWHDGATQGFTIVPTDLDDWAWLQTTNASGCKEHARLFVSNTLFADSFE